MTQGNACPCCSGKNFVECCKSIIEGKVIAANPVELMRSRYTAHACKNMPHIIRTMRGKALKLFDKEKTEEEWFELCNWIKLEIIDASAVDKNSKHGIVEFKAYCVFNGEEQILHERSKFSKIDNQWYYISGQHKNAVIHAADKVGRNEECPCGSGKKYKKCCSANVAD